MKIYRGELTQDQVDAGMGAMKGKFTSSKVMKALGQAGVVNIVSGAEVLIARELRNGHIRRITRGSYRKISERKP